MTPVRKSFTVKVQSGRPHPCLQLRYFTSTRATISACLTGGMGTEIADTVGNKTIHTGDNSPCFGQFTPETIHPAR